MVIDVNRSRLQFSKLFLKQYDVKLCDYTLMWPFYGAQFPSISMVLSIWDEPRSKTLSPWAAQWFFAKRAALWELASKKSNPLGNRESKPHFNQVTQNATSIIWCIDLKQLDQQAWKCSKRFSFVGTACKPKDYRLALRVKYQGQNAGTNSRWSGSLELVTQIAYCYSRGYEVISFVTRPAIDGVDVFLRLVVQLLCLVLKLFALILQVCLVDSFGILTQVKLDAGD